MVAKPVEEQSDLESLIATIESRLDQPRSTPSSFPQTVGASSFIQERSKNVEDWDGDNSVTKI